MRNLSLPSLSYYRLESSLLPDKRKQIGYATHAVLRCLSDGEAFVEIEHHGSLIATVSGAFVSITDAGYASSTTIDRLHKVMVDNGLWPDSYTIDIRQGSTVILTPSTMRKGLASLSAFENNTADFQLTETGWQLLDIDTP